MVINTAKENISQEFRLENIEEIKNWITKWINKQIDQNELMSKKHKKVCRPLNYIEHLLILASAVTGYVSNSVFASLIGIPIGITSSAVGMKICAITAVIKKSISQLLRKRRRNMIK